MWAYFCACFFLLVWDEDPAVFLRQTKNPVSAGGNPEFSRGSGRVQLNHIGKIIAFNPENCSDGFHEVAFFTTVGSEIIVRKVLKTDSLAYGIYGTFRVKVWAAAGNQFQILIADCRALDVLIHNFRLLQIKFICMLFFHFFIRMIFRYGRKIFRGSAIIFVPWLFRF